MLTTNITLAEKYDYLSDKFKKAFTFLRETDLASLPIGRTEIDGDEVYASVHSYTTMTVEECGCNLLRRENLTNTLLAHELFHAVEERHVKEIYTRTERVELWRKPFSNKSTISCLSEIAAMAFAGKLLDLKVSPYMLDVLLVYSYDKNAAWGLYDEIMNIRGAQ